MSAFHASRSWWRRSVFTGVMLLLAVAQAGSASGQFVLRLHSVAGTGDTRVARGCFRLSSTIGEAVAAPARAGDLTLFSGFWGARPQATERDSLFSNGFENCRL